MEIGNIDRPADPGYPKVRVSERVTQWMETARWAASGGNAQPWKVDVLNGAGSIVVKISIDPKYRLNRSPMDVDGLASAIAIGCLARNLESVAANDGYAMRVSRFENFPSVWDSTVILEFHTDPSASTRFDDQDVLSRRTDRARLHRKPVPKKIVDEIEKIARRHVGMRFQSFSDSTARRKSELLPHLASLEKIRWRNAVLLNGLLKEISFKKEESTDKIPATQLGISRPDQWLLRFFRRYPLMRALFRFGFDAIPVKQAVGVFSRHCDRICFLEARLNGSPEDFQRSVELGQCFQEQWLEASKHELSLQPLGLPLIALGFWRGDQTLGFSATQRRRIETVTAQFEKLFDINLRHLVIGFRLGYPTTQAGRSPRKQADVNRSPTRP